MYNKLPKPHGSRYWILGDPDIVKPKTISEIDDLAQSRYLYLVWEGVSKDYSGKSIKMKIRRIISHKEIPTKGTLVTFLSGSRRNKKYRSFYWEKVQHAELRPE